MADFTYMGSKKLLAPRIAELVATMADGPFLDLFSGIAAVGTQVGVTRPIWSNDVQHFSGLLTQQRFRARYAFRSAATLIARSSVHFAANASALKTAFADILSAETRALQSESADQAQSLATAVSQLASERTSVLRGEGWHCLFTVTHGGTYVGIQQAIALDSIRYAADTMLSDGGITDEDHRWMILALCQAVSTINNSTGHFAQYLSPSEGNIKRIVRKRRMDVHTLSATALLSYRPLGTVAWRRGNRTFNSDAVTLLSTLANWSQQPAVIYADPPYTSDQYSRYYHVLENAVRYDYPETSGKGQYRSDRYTSGFSLKAGVRRSFEDLIASAAKLRSVLVLSYPTNGLLRVRTR
jgi:adenine-specific DNA-methyltransferase